MRSVSVVVPTFNRWERLARVVDALGRQVLDGCELEIIVVSDGSTDGTDQRLRELDLPGVSVLSQANKGPGAARNAGVAASRGDLIVFIDDDVIPEPGCIAAHLATHAETAAPSVVIGPLLTPEAVVQEPWVQWEQRMLYKQYDAMKRGDYGASARQFYTGNASLDRASFLDAGGFDESLRRAEDVELGYRLADLGMSFVFEPEARAFHHAERSYESWLAIPEAYGRTDVAFRRDGGEEWLVFEIRAEFAQRSPITRAITRLGVRLPILRWLARTVAPKWISLGRKLGFSNAGQRLLSAVFNFEYYASLAHELGGVGEFLALVGSRSPDEEGA